MDWAERLPPLPPTAREGTLGRTEFVDELDSTSAEARRRALAGETGPLWIAARRQTAGQGRRGRPWSMSEGDLAASLLLTRAGGPAEAAPASFVAALAVADLVSEFVEPSAVALKWPNDVLLGGGKVSGVLVESGPRPGGIWLTVGIGVNIVSAPSGVDRPAACIAGHLKPRLQAPSPEAALERLAAAFACRMRMWDEQGLAAVLDAWRARGSGLPGPCSVRLGGQTLSGTAEGLDPDGALRLRLANGEVRRITAGDVFFGGA